MTERSTAGFVRTMLKFEREGVTGVLTVSAEGVATKIHYRAGSAVFASGGTNSDALGRLLVEEGAITEEEYAHAIQLMAQSLGEREEMRMGDVLTRLRYITEDGLEQALELQVRRKIMRCLQWDSMTLTFEPMHATAGQFPTPIEPLIAEGVYYFYSQERMDQLLAPLHPFFLSLGSPLATVIARFAMGDPYDDVIERLDGQTTMQALLADPALDENVTWPVLTSLFLANELKPLKDRLRLVPAREPRPEPPREPMREPPPQVPPPQVAPTKLSKSGKRPARPRPKPTVSRRQRGVFERDERKSHDGRAPTRDAGKRAPAQQVHDPAPRRQRTTGRGDLPRRQSPSHRAPDAYDEIPMPDEPPPEERSREEQPPRRMRHSFPRRGLVTRNPLPRRGSRTAQRDEVPESPDAPPDAAAAQEAPASQHGAPRRRDRPTWKQADLPRRLEGTHAALGEGPNERLEATPSMVPLPSVHDKRLRLGAEEAYRRGMRDLHAQRHQAALTALTAAAEMMPGSLEYELAAKWVVYCETEDAEQREGLINQLKKLAKQAAQQNRSLPFPPYVLGHVYLAEGDEARAVRLFKVASYRDPQNVDAARHLQVLSKRLGRA